MADNYLITGYWGEPHVTAENDRGINAATFGKGRFVLPVGEQFNAEYIGNNTIRLYDGKLMDNGAAAGIPVGEYVDLLISNAGQGLRRNDLIVFQYKKDASTLKESGTFIVVEGIAVSGTPSDPNLTQADILSGKATLDQMALWRVSVSGTTIAAPTKLFSVVPDTLKDHTGNKSNPHGVTKAQVGLSNVPNVATNNQTPTYTVASTLAALASGEKLSVAFGKIAKAVTDLISHIANKNNPHAVTAAQVGAMPDGFELATDLRGVNKSTIVLTNADTLNTPYTVGLTTYTNGLCIVGYVNASNRTLLYFSRNNHEIFIQRQVGGNWGAWMKDYHEGNKPNAADVGAVPTTRKVNGKALSADVTLSAADVGAISSSGSNTFTGDLTVAKANAAITAKNTTSTRAATLQSMEDGSAYLHNMLDSNHRSCLRLKAETDDLASALMLSRITGSNPEDIHAYNVLHTGNKSFGEYTGNGSSEQRRIETGGIGRAAIVWSSRGVAVLTRSDCFHTYSGEFGVLDQTKGHVEDGVIVLATDHSVLNGSGVAYCYQLI